MFCKIIEGKIVQPSSFFGEREFQLSYQEFISKPEGFYIYDDLTEDIIPNPNFEYLQAEKINFKLKENLKKQLEELDIKRIRAICEPTVKDTETGETWLEFYNNQIQELRNQVMALG